MRMIDDDNDDDDYDDFLEMMVDNDR